MRVLLSVLFATSLAAKVSPLEKTVQLLTELQAKVVKDGENAQKLYEEFSTLCKDGSVQTQFEIKTATSDAERAQATVEQNDAAITTSQSKIGDLSSSIATNEADLAAATEIRNKEKADFARVDADLAETIDMIGRAVGIIEREMKKSSFVQTDSMQSIADALQAVISAASVSSTDKAKVQALLQSGTDDMELQPAGAPAASAYDSHSGGIVQTLQDMLDKSQAQRADGQKGEMNADFDFKMLKQKLEDAVAAETKELNEQKKAKAGAEEAKAIAQSELNSANDDIKQGNEKLQKMQSGCMDHAQSFETEQHERAGELEALDKAKAILSEKTGGAAARTYSFIQVSAKKTQPVSDRVLSMVQKLAKDDKSLAQLAARIQSATAMGGDPFGKVKTMITEMIDQLVAEAAKEAAHKAYCDKEMSETKAKREDKETDVDDLDTKIDKAESRIAKLTESITNLENELAQIAKQQQEATSLRQSEKSAWGEAKVDYDSGVEGVGMALQVLRDYYAEKDAALMQMEKHSKSSGSASGIIGMLEVVESDFTRLLAEGQAGEDAAQKEYDISTQENKIATATKRTELKFKSKDKKETEAALAELKDDREGATSELNAIIEYWDKLQPVCIAKPEPYAERKRRREAEISGLKEAMRILEEESAGASFLQIRRA